MKSKRIITAVSLMLAVAIAIPSAAEARFRDPAPNLPRTIPQAPAPSPVKEAALNAIGNQIGKYLSGAGATGGVLQLMRVVSICPECLLVGLA